MTTKHVFGTAGAILLVAMRFQAQQPADLVLHSGQIFTADNMTSVYEALVIRDGKIVEVGPDEIISRYRADREIDLRGRLVIPGFINTHLHVRGRSKRHVALATAESIDEIKQRIRRKAEALGPGKWVTGGGWSEYELEEQRRPLRRDLDEAAPDNPVLIYRAGAHSAVANSRALDRAGITGETPDPEDGIIECQSRVEQNRGLRDVGASLVGARGKPHAFPAPQSLFSISTPDSHIEHTADGELNGVLRENAMGLVSRLIPDASFEETRESFIANLKHLLSLGVTSIIEASTSPERFARQWQDVYEEHGAELPRAAVQIRVAPGDTEASAEAAIAALRAFGETTGAGDHRLRVGAVKVFVDGGFTGPAAWTLEHYPGQPDYYGIQEVSKRALYTLSKTAHERGWQLGYHAIGDAAIQMTVDVFSRILEEAPRKNHRHYLNHFTVLPPEETLRQMAQGNILIAQQPNFTYTLAGRYAENLAGERLQTNNAVATPMRHGIFMAFGSDNLPIGPMTGLYAAVTRRGMDGEVYGSAERISMPEAIVAYTRNGAYFTFEEEFKGTLEPGKAADLVVLSRDLLTIDPEHILETHVDMTILDGNVVYERSAAATSVGQDR